jgi:PAS domain S-box-containing protein
VPKIVFDSNVQPNALSSLLEGYLSGLGEVCHTLFGAKGEAVMYEAVGDAFKRYLKKKKGIDFTRLDPWDRYCEVVEFFTAQGFYSHVELDEAGGGRYWMLEAGQYAGAIWEEEKSWERGTPPCPLWAIIVRTQAEIGYRIVLDEVDFRPDMNGYESTFHFEKFNTGKEGILDRALREIRESIFATYMLNAVAENTTDAIFLKDLEGRYLFANKAVSQIVGKPVEEILGNHDTALFAPGTAAAILGNDREVARSGRGVTFEETILSGGATRTFSTTKGSYQDTGGNLAGLFGISRDITERKQAEVALQRLNRELRAISDCNQILVRAEHENDLLNEICRVICDEAGYRMAWVGYAENDDAKTIRPVAVAGAEDGYLADARITWADTEWGRGPSGTAIRSGESACIQDFTTDPQAGPWRVKALLHGYRSSVALPIKDNKQRTFGVLNIYSGEAGAFTPDEIRLLEGLSVDLAFGLMVLRARAERERANLEIKGLAAIVASSDDAIIGKTPEGIITSWNGGAEKIYGYSQGEIVGKSISILVPPGLEDETPRILARIRSGEHIEHYETARQRKDGRLIQISLTISPIYDAQGRIIAASAVGRDITEKAKLEEQLRHSQKMEAIGLLAGGVAHDFNNILTAIIGFANLVKMKMAPGDPLRAGIDQILVSSDRAAHLTQGLLAFSRKQVIIPKPADLNAIVRSVEKLIGRLIGEDIEFTTQLSAQSLIVMADAGQIEQVLMNLATNARDAMPNGGELSICTGKMVVGEDSAGAHEYGPPGRYAMITVSDTGAGMNEATREKIFEPFFTTKEPGKGTGLGLSMVYGIVKQHEGNLSVSSEPGKGATFRILLPLIATEVEEPFAETDAPPPGGTETILLAEDDLDVRDLTTTVLRDFGYRVIEAVDGKDALEKYAGDSGNIDLLILDVIMPRMGGKETFDAVKAINPGSKILFISGYTADGFHKKGLFSEGVQFIAKPMSPFELLKKVRAVLDGKG